MEFDDFNLSRLPCPFVIGFIAEWAQASRLVLDC